MSAGTPAEALRRTPALADGVSIDPPLRAGDPWVLARDGVPRARIGEDTADVLRALDGARRLDEVVHRAGVATDPSALLALLHALERADLLARPVSTPVTASAVSRPRRRLRVHRRAPRSTPGRVEFRAPLTVRVRLIRPGPLAALLARPLRSPAVSRAVALGGATLVALGLLGVILGGGEILTRALLEPVPLSTLLIAIMGGFLLTLAHELAHAVALSRAGGTPTHLGIMLLAGIPAFFCDVTDGWRLGSRRARVGVALAGPALNLVVAATALLAAVLARVLTGDGPLSAALALLAAMSMLSAVLNLVPVLPFDGYLALMAATDTPYLRERALTSAADALAGRPGPPGDDTRPPLQATGRLRRGVVVVFGVACALAPYLVPVYAVARLGPVLAGAGAVGAALQLLLAALLLALLLRGARRLLRALRRRRPAPLRRLVLALGGAVVLALLAAIPVPVRETVGIARLDGGLALVAERGTELRDVRVGERLDLTTMGILGGHTLGTVTIQARGELTEAEVPLDALTPFRGEETRIPAAVLPIALTPASAAARVPSTGRAHLHRETEPAIHAGLRLLIRTPLRALLPDGGAA